MMDEQRTAMELNARVARVIGEMTIQIQAITLEREKLQARVQELEETLVTRHGGPSLKTVGEVER
jgi:hypothetical protein